MGLSAESNFLAPAVSVWTGILWPETKTITQDNVPSRWKRMASRMKDWVNHERNAQLYLVRAACWDENTPTSHIAERSDLSL
jgi:hypothetical protein